MQTERNVKVVQRKCQFMKIWLSDYRTAKNRGQSSQPTTLFLLFFKVRWLFFCLQLWKSGSLHNGRTKGTARHNACFFRSLFFFFSNSSKITNTQPTRTTLFLSTRGHIRFITFPTYTAFDDISFSCKSCCWSYREFALHQQICPSEYLKIGSLKFTLMKTLKEGISLATIERLFFAVRSCAWASASRPG